MRRGLAALELAGDLGKGLGPYGLQAAVASLHARAMTLAAPDWVSIVALYDALGEIAPSPVIDLNKAVALSMAYGPQAGIDLVDALANDPSLASYHLVSSVRGDLLERLGRKDEARLAFAHAATGAQRGQARRSASRAWRLSNQTRRGPNRHTTSQRALSGRDDLVDLEDAWCRRERSDDFVGNRAIRGSNT